MTWCIFHRTKWPLRYDDINGIFSNIQTNVRTFGTTFLESIYHVNSEKQSFKNAAKFVWELWQSFSKKVEFFENSIFSIFRCYTLGFFKYAVYIRIQHVKLYLKMYKNWKNKNCSNFAFPAPYKSQEMVSVKN